MAPAAKRRRVDTQPADEIKFDPSARQDYLTGFHKRKQARKENARETAAKREKEERVKERKQMREQRKQDLDRHIAEFNAELKKQNPDLSESDPDTGVEAKVNGEAEEWQGIEEQPEDVGQEDEYVDEDKYTTVTVEAMGESVSEGEGAEDTRPLDKSSTVDGEGATTNKKRIWAKDKPDDGKPKPKKRKFRYESKAERQDTRRKQKNKSKAAKARREGR